MSTVAIVKDAAGQLATDAAYWALLIGIGAAVVWYGGKAVYNAAGDVLEEHGTSIIDHGTGILTPSYYFARHAHDILALLGLADDSSEVQGDVIEDGGAW